jgi:hypothetical protein
MEFADERLFGVEIEFPDIRGVRMYGIVDALNDAGLSTEEEGYNHQHRSHWKLTTDATCGLELVSPPMRGLEAREQIVTAVKTLRELGASVNRNCGLHVHHDARDLTTKQFKDTVMLWHTHQPLVTEMMPRSRRGNEWCRPNSYPDLKARVGTASQQTLRSERMMEDRYGYRLPAYRHSMSKEAAVDSLGGGTGRYMALNVHSYPRHGTLEFRQHQGTLNGSKIWNWVVFTQMFVTAGMLRKYEPEPSASPARRVATLRNHLRMNGSGESDEVTKQAFEFMLRRRRQYASG